MADRRGERKLGYPHSVSNNASISFCECEKLELHDYDKIKSNLVIADIHLRMVMDKLEFCDNSFYNAHFDDICNISKAIGSINSLTKAIKIILEDENYAIF